MSRDNSVDYWNHAYTLCELAHVALTEKDYPMAAHHFHQALRLAIRWSSVGLTLVIIAGFAHMWLYQKQYQQAIALAVMVLNHEATWAETKPMAENVLATTVQHMTPAAFQEAQATGEMYELTAVVADLLAESP